MLTEVTGTARVVFGREARGAGAGLAVQRMRSVATSANSRRPNCLRHVAASVMMAEARGQKVDSHMPSVKTLDSRGARG